MKQRIEVRSQAEFNACVEAGNIAIVIGCSVEARGNSSVEAWGNVFVRLFAALKVKVSASCVVMIHGQAKSLIGGKRVKATKPATAKAWCDQYGVAHKGGVATLYKAVDDDYSTDRARSKGIFYRPGEAPVAPDWDDGKEECGGGLHFSPHPEMALEFNTGAKRFVACSVKLKDIAVHPYGRYPQKVKAKGLCAPVYEVDRKGRRIAGAK